MDDREFFRAFRSRDINDLHASKDQEKLVDDMIKDNGQKQLFDD